jgi:hypothetical protein
MPNGKEIVREKVFLGSGEGEVVREVISSTSIDMIMIFLC